MNIEEANNLDFLQLMADLNYTPIQGKGRAGGAKEDIWYHSPLRSTDKTPSFHIRTGRIYKYVAHDFGGLGHMTLVQFIKHHQGCDTKTALKFLRKLYPDWQSRVGRISTGKPRKTPIQQSFTAPANPIPEPPVFHNTPEEFRQLEFVQDLPLTSEIVLKYLEGRNIAREVAQQYFRLIKYRNKKKRTQKLNFGFGMKNKSGGWEVRSASDKDGQIYKSALITRDITVVKGTDEKRGVNVFEGQMDFVSLLMMIGTNHFVGDTVILNGMQSYGRAKAYIEQEDYGKIFTFLDNDDGGKATTEKFIADFGNKVINHSPSFAPHKDVNKALVAGHRPKFTQTPEPPKPQEP